MANLIEPGAAVSVDGLTVPAFPETLARRQRCPITGRPRIVRFSSRILLAAMAVCFLGTATVASAQQAAIEPGGPSIVRNVEGANERMEMIVNTSRILTLNQKIKTVQVNNREVLHPTPLSPNQVQISAKRAGVDQVNLWTEDGQIHTIDVMVINDARQLEQELKMHFPESSLRVVPVANSVRISGFVDQPEYVMQVIQIAQEYYPKVINSITVSGVQQVLLHVKIMEVSRTKLRTLGFDWAQISGNNIVASSASGLLGTVGAGSVTTSGNEDFFFSIVHGSNAFFGILEAMREDKLLKILSEPTLVTLSGQPASFNVGGEIPILTPQSLGTTSIEYKKYGTQLDFVPICLGNGKVRLEVWPKVSEIDPANSVELFGVSVPGLRSREVKTSVELNAGQTLAIAGLLQNRVESERRGLPWVSEVPYLGSMFRRTSDRVNEIELIVFVTPELVDALDPDQVPPCGPGTFTTQPSDCELYLKGHVEVPRCCPTDGAEGAGGMPCEAAPNGEPMPGMILEPRPAPDGPIPGSVGSSQNPVHQTARQPRAVPYNPVNPQNPQSSGSTAAPKPLPGFKGSVGYEMLR